jgi:2-iminobutanoate/2-iminopropanoate deaminase
MPALWLDFAYVSGQPPTDNNGRPLSDQSFETRVNQVLANPDACLAVAGTDRSQLVQACVY